jgi:pilus assembly protein Flp/PilA
MMTQIKSILVGWSRDEEGASLVEYVLIVALISVVSILAMGPLGTKIRETFERVTVQIPNQ